MSRIEGIRHVVKQVEPYVEIVEQSNAESDEDADFDIKHELILIGVAVALFVVGLIFKSSLHATPTALANTSSLPRPILCRWGATPAEQKWKLFFRIYTKCTLK